MAAAVAGLLAACSSGAASDTAAGLELSCVAGDVGDLSLPPELELYNQLADGVSAKIECGGPLALLTPPQGGRVSFVGMRVRNMSACGVKVVSRVSNEAGDETREDTRTVDLDPLPDAWAGSVDTRISSFSHVTMCPNDWSSADVEGTNFDLSVTVTDPSGRQAAAFVRIVPECAEADKLDSCRCLCGAEFAPGVLCGN